MQDDNKTNAGEILDLHLSESLDEEKNEITYMHTALRVKAGNTKIKEDKLYAILAVWEEQSLIMNWYKNQVFSGKTVMDEYNSILNKSQYRIYEVSEITEVLTGEAPIHHEIDSID